MLEWLRGPAAANGPPAVPELALQLAAAFVLGCAVAGIYHFTRRSSRGETPSLVPTLVLLTILIAMVTLAIGNSPARAFTLVGALAIVRFRTVVEDTRDTAFVIFAVAVGMAVAADYLTVALLGIPVAGAAAFLFRPGARANRDVPPTFTLTVRVGAGNDPEALVRGVCDKHLEHAELVATSTARQGAALDLTYEVRLRRDAGPVALVAELNAVEGVQNVELRRE